MNRYIITKDITQCCGCSACVDRCPKKCLKMTTDTDGFYVPEMVDEANCVDCGLCSKVCPFENAETHEQTTEFYAAYSTKRQLIMNSSSGGIFPEIACAFLKRGGAVYGAYMDSKFDLYHLCITDLNELPKLMRSKYYQSEIRNTYIECKKDLDGGKQVLFSGVPCQIQGLKNFLGKEYENLFTIDVICHGVPSPLMFKGYKSYLERKHRGGQVIEANFRDKEKYGWSVSMKYVIKTNNGKKKSYTDMYNFSGYLHPFLAGLLTRESCYHCPFSSLKRPGDMTLGDFFGFQNARPELVHKEGLSLILVNSTKGKVLQNILREENVVMTSVTESDVRSSGIRNLYAPTERPALRDKIYVTLHSHGFDYLMKHYLKPKLTLRQRIRRMIPDHIIDFIKKIIK